MYKPWFAMTTKAGSQYDATRAMRGVKRARIRRNSLGFYSCVSCVHALRRIVNRTLVILCNTMQAIITSQPFFK